MLGQAVRLINLIVHDDGQGFGFWTTTVDSEIYGSLVYNNGWLGPDRGHGHAIYTQNLDGTKRIYDNILFNQFSYGIHAYTEGGSIQGFDIAGNLQIGDTNHRSSDLGEAGRGRGGFTQKLLPIPLALFTFPLYDISLSIKPGYGFYKGILR